MPVDLVLVRHGQSEGNLAQKLSREGDVSHWSKEFRERHNSLYRLTDTGRLQARIAGEYIKAFISPYFDKYFTSEYVRFGCT
jgi:broad specificity phosphatase PhoE